jgi:hypothetical protein
VKAAGRQDRVGGKPSEAERSVAERNPGTAAFAANPGAPQLGNIIAPVGKCEKFYNAWIFTAIKVFRELIHM